MFLSTYFRRRVSRAFWDQFGIQKPVDKVYTSSCQTYCTRVESDPCPSILLEITNLVKNALEPEDARDREMVSPVIMHIIATVTECYVSGTVSSSVSWYRILYKQVRLTCPALGYPHFQLLDSLLQYTRSPGRLRLPRDQGQVSGRTILHFQDPHRP